MIGSTLGHYKLLEQIGHGGMGVVYRARDEHLERDVAIKVLPAGALADDAARQRFRREALTLSRLDHPSIAAVHDFATQDGVDFLVMELVRGESLEERMARGALPEAEVRSIGAQIADALEVAHEQGVVHRDLKPANVLITAQGRIKVLDFGIARLLGKAEGSGLSDDALTETGVVLGTVSYMAPEQLLGRALDGRADLYALGVILYEMATGRSPYADSIATALVNEILHEPPKPLRRVSASVSPKLEAIVLHCLEKDPEHRYASARDLARDLRSGSVAPVRRKSLTTRWIAAAVAVLLAVVMYGLWPRPNSLAVLPLENLSRDPEQDYFADGMTEELSTKLAKISALRVIAHGSVVSAFKRHDSARETGKSLHVRTLLAGSVRSDQDRIRITLELMQVATGKVLWAESYDRPLRDVLTLQSEVAGMVAREVQAKLTRQEKTIVASSRQVDPQAYRLCLKGRYIWDNYTSQGFDEAEKAFRGALDLDPSYAPAWAGLADVFYGRSSQTLAPNLAMPVAREAALKAVSLDSTLADGHTSLGIVKTVYDFDWKGAEAEFDRALALRPNDANAHLWRGFLLACLGRFDESLADARMAAILDPLSPWAQASLARVLYMARRNDEALQQLRRCIATDASYYVNYLLMGIVLEAMKDHKGSIAALEKANALIHSGESLSSLAYSLAKAGRTQDANRLIQELKERSRHEFISAGVLMHAYAAFENKNEALDWLERAYEERSEYLIFLKVDPQLDGMRSEPRFRSMLQRLSL